MIRTPIALIPYIFALAAFCGGLLWQLGDEAAPGSTQVYGTAVVGGPFTLMDQDGKTRTDQDFRGKFMLVYFGYTHCPDVCPLTLSVMAGALQELGASADRIVPIFVTVDPARDTPKIMREYVASFGPRFVGLTGTPQQIARVAREYHVYYAKQSPAHGGYEVNHSSVIYLMDTSGRFAADYDETLGPDGLAKALRARL
jgi:protein SCO1/2